MGVDIAASLGEILAKCQRANVNPGDIILVLKILRGGGAGRYRLKSELSLGEATVRTMLKHLRELGYVRAEEKAHVLTEKGERLIDTIMSFVKFEGEIRTPYRLGESEYYICASGLGGKVGSGVEQRDRALLSGGRGALTLIYRSGEGLVFPDSGVRLKDVCPELADDLSRRGSLVSGDVVLIVGADTPERAKSVAYSVLATLLS